MNWKEEGDQGLIKVLPQHLHGWAEEHHSEQSPQSEYQALLNTSLEHYNIHKVLAYITEFLFIAKYYASQNSDTICNTHMSNHKVPFIHGNKNVGC